MEKAILNNMAAPTTASPVSNHNIDLGALAARLEPMKRPKNSVLARWPSFRVSVFNRDLEPKLVHQEQVDGLNPAKLKRLRCPGLYAEARYQLNKLGKSAVIYNDSVWLYELG